MVIQLVRGVRTETHRWLQCHHAWGGPQGPCWRDRKYPWPWPSPSPSPQASRIGGPKSCRRRSTHAPLGDMVVYTHLSSIVGRGLCLTLLVQCSIVAAHSFGFISTTSLSETLLPHYMLLTHLPNLFLVVLLSFSFTNASWGAREHVAAQTIEKLEFWSTLSYANRVK